jgi:hypothetical protein
MIDPGVLSAEENAALSAFRSAKGRSWKAALQLNWERSHYPGVDANVSSVLQRMRNTRGPEWLAQYSPEKEAEKAHEAALTGSVIAEFAAMAVELGVPVVKSEAAGRQMFGSMAKAFDKSAKEQDRDLRRCKLPVAPRLKPELEVVAWLDAQPVDRRRGSVAMYARPYVALYQDFEHDTVAGPVDVPGELGFAAKAALGVEAIDRGVKPAGFISDVPNEQWLAEKVEDVIAGGRNRYGVLKFFGPITGRFDRTMNLPVGELVGLPGECNEQSNVRPDALEFIRANFEAVSAEPVYVEVDPLGVAWVSEGNHRIMVAAEMGVLSLPVNVRYFSGGERTSVWRCKWGLRCPWKLWL